MIRRALLLALLALLALGSSFLLFQQATQGAQGTISIVALDTSANNTATELDGNIEPCAEVASGQSVDVDLVVDAIPAGSPAVTWLAAIFYDDTLLSVTANDSNLLATSNGATPMSLSDPVPDTGANGALDPGVYVASILIIPPDTPVAGEGVLHRLTIQAASGGSNAPAGLYPLTLGAPPGEPADLPNALNVASLQGPIPITNIGNALIAVDQDCPAELPTPIPVDGGPTGEPPPAGATATAVAGATATAAAGATATAAATATPPTGTEPPAGTATASPVGTPGTPDSGTPTMDDGDDDASDDGTPWVAIIVGVVVALVIAGGAAATLYWRWWRHRASP